MHKPFPAYDGNDPYIFVSYAHKDSAEIYPQLTWLNTKGFNVWYDEGIEPGSEWSNELAGAIENASTFLFFGTPRSAGSNNCIDEVSFALDNDIPFLAVYLVETKLPSGMKMRVNRHQAIFKHELDEAQYQEKLATGLTKLLKLDHGSADIDIDEKALPTRTTSNLQRRLTTILAADVCGYTRLMEMDEERTHARVQSSRRVFKEHIEAVGGRIFNTAGDSIMAEFNSVFEGVQAAISIQDGVAAQESDSTPENRISFRMGVQIGEVIPDETGDLFGDCVNIAARLEQAGIPGQVTISETVLGYLKNKIILPMEPLGSVKLKNVTTPMALFSVVPKTATEVVVPQKSKSATVHKSLAILPFTSRNGDSESEDLCIGIQEELLAALSKFKELELAGRVATESLKGQQDDYVSIGARLGVEFIVTGSVQRSGNRVRIYVQLDRTGDGRTVISERYDGTLDDVFALQDEIVAKIIDALLYSGDLELGTVLKERYLLDDYWELGGDSNGVGSVYKALDLEAKGKGKKDPFVAVRVFNETLASDESIVGLMKSRSTAIKGLKHPNILTYFDFDIDGDTTFLVLELIEGQPLDEFLRAHPEGIPTEEAWTLIDGVSKGLEYAHRDGILHLDLKPGNIFYTENKVAKLFDFNSSEILDKAELSIRSIYGSLERMSGGASSTADDVYSLALLSYELLTGRHPYGRLCSNEALQKGISPMSIDSLSNLQWQTLLKAMQLKTEDRIQTVSEFRSGMFSA